MKTQPTFDPLTSALSTAHQTLQAQAVRAVNTGLTLRNWLFGFYIETYERGGVDRQQYGDKLLDKLAQTLAAQGVSRSDRRELYRYRQFYLAYPYSHPNAPNIPKQEVVKAADAVERFLKLARKK